MTYKDLLAAGRAMSPEEREASIHELAKDPRFSAVVGLLDHCKAGFVSAGSVQAIASQHGTMSHCMGSVHGIGVVEGIIGEIMNPRRRAPARRPDQE